MENLTLSRAIRFLDIRNEDFIYFSIRGNSEINPNIYSAQVGKIRKIFNMKKIEVEKATPHFDMYDGEMMGYNMVIKLNGITAEEFMNMFWRLK